MNTTNTNYLQPYNSLRRYDFVTYDSGKTLGRSTSCSKRSINSWFRWFVHCSYCLCLCDEQSRFSDRYFNTRLVLADVTNNRWELFKLEFKVRLTKRQYYFRVVTGLRIVKHNRIIHLQIQEGKLLPFGYIDNTTVRWVPVDDFKITDVGIKRGDDYHLMTYSNRKLLLDELTPHETNQIITGEFNILTTPGISLSEPSAFSKGSIFKISKRVSMMNCCWTSG